MSDALDDPAGAGLYKTTSLTSQSSQDAVATAELLEQLCLPTSVTLAVIRRTSMYDKHFKHRWKECILEVHGYGLFIFKDAEEIALRKEHSRKSQLVLPRKCVLLKDCFIERLSKTPDRKTGETRYYSVVRWERGEYAFRFATATDQDSFMAAVSAYSRKEPIVRAENILGPPLQSWIRSRSPNGSRGVSPEPARSLGLGKKRAAFMGWLRRERSNGNSVRGSSARLYGVALAQHLSFCCGERGHVPLLLIRCIEALNARDCVNVVGLYRISPSMLAVQSLKEELDADEETPNLFDEKYDIHCLCGVLKLYFRELPDSIVTSTYYAAFIRAGRLEVLEERCQQLAELVQNQLPRANYETLRMLMRHLHEVANNSAVNKMTALNLAIVFGPTVIRPKYDNDLQSVMDDHGFQCKVTEAMIQHFETIFETPIRPPVLRVPTSAPKLSLAITTSGLSTESPATDRPTAWIPQRASMPALDSAHSQHTPQSPSPLSPTLGTRMLRIKSPASTQTDLTKRQSRYITDFEFAEMSGLRHLSTEDPFRSEDEDDDDEYNNTNNNNDEDDSL